METCFASLSLVAQGFVNGKVVGLVSELLMLA